MGFDWGFDYDYNPLRNCDLIEELIVQVHDLMDQNLRIWFGIFPNSGCDANVPLWQSEKQDPT